MMLESWTHAFKFGLQRTKPALKRKPTKEKIKCHSLGRGLVSMRAKPLHDRVLVKRFEEGEVVKGGIIIPDTAKEKPMEGEVVAVGPGKMQDDGKRSPMDVKTGDRILFGKYSGTEIKIDDQDYTIMREEEILAVLESGKK
jgi:chaperonin GroES